MQPAAPGNPMASEKDAFAEQHNQGSLTVYAPKGRDRPHPPAGLPGPKDGQAQRHSLTLCPNLTI